MMAFSQREDDNKYQKVSQKAPQKQAKVPHKFIWLKNELQIYLVFVVLLCAYQVFEIAQASQNAAKKYNIVGLTPGYFGLLRDDNDSQWREWRNNIDALLFAAAVHLVLSAVIKKMYTQGKSRNILLVFNVVAGTGYLIFLLQAGIIFWAVFSSGFYAVIKSMHKLRAFPFVLWGLSLGTLYFNETYHGYSLNFISPELDHSMNSSPIKWSTIYNMTILRMISFGMDLYWSKTKNDPAQQPKLQGSFTYRQRQEASQPAEDYSLLAYLSYLLYVPLYLTGPIITFNAWNSQINAPQTAYTPKQVFEYGVKRFALVFACFEVFLHFIYVNAIATNKANAHIWQNDFEIRTILFMSLMELFFLWFKFLIFWRFARLWALIDGVETPENMNRCVANNYNFENFWRSWHRSFNQWLIRYIFIPLGGGKYKILNVWVIFSFVAVWHDMNWNLLMWCWIICLTLMPEMAIKWYFQREKNRYLWNKVWFRLLCAFAGTVLVFFMIVANLIGYGTGYDGMIMILKRVVSEKSYGSIIGAFVWVFTATNLNFRVRELEAERGEAKNH